MAASTLTITLDVALTDEAIEQLACAYDCVHESFRSEPFSLDRAVLRAVDRIRFHVELLAMRARNQLRQLTKGASAC